MAELYEIWQLHPKLFKLRSVLRYARHAIRDVLLKPEKNYRFYLKYQFKADKTHGSPNAPWSNAVLRTHQEVEDAVRQVETLGLPQRSDLPKNWDSLAALDCILRKTDTEARIFVAGAELSCSILPW